MASFKNFLTGINQKMGASLPSNWEELSEIKLAQIFLERLNEYFFQTYEGVGSTVFNGEELQYFSEFHKFWEANHNEILNPRVNRDKAKQAARALSNAVNKYGSQILGVTHSTFGLQPQAIAQVRFFTANQDFRESPKSPYALYLDDDGIFDPAEIIENPGSFLNRLGLTRLSQTDKRLDYARNAAKFLIEKDISAFGISEYYGDDASVIRETLINTPNMGYGPKKANMFIRDMVKLGAWPHLKEFDKIDVASDINTMKVCLRTGVLTTEIPLLSSFLDIFCHQYSSIDEASASAWRVVWEEWSNMDEQGAPLSPCEMDFLLYRIGREYCKFNVVKYECEKGHVFYHFGSRLSSCRVCRTHKEKSRACPTERYLPCQVNQNELPRENGKLLLKDEDLLSIFDGACIFKEVCNPKSQEFRALDPPKSISIKGQTSWTNSTANRDRGGGGMMG